MRRYRDEGTLEERMLENVKVAVIVEVADREVYRRVCAVAEQAWDAGAEVRVRRARASNEMVAGGEGAGWSALPCEADDVPEVHPDDISWADVVVRGNATMPLDALDALERSVELTRAG
jgi:NAD(P)H dehydrogenase (quinone)